MTIVAQPDFEGRVRRHLASDQPTREEFVTAVSHALGGYEYLANTSEFAAYTQYGVNLRLGPTGQMLNERLFSPEEAARFNSWLTDGALLRYGLRSVMPQVKLKNGAGADPFYILQVAPKDSLRPVDDPRFDLAVVDRSYDELVWQPFAFDVSVDTARTFERSRFIDAEGGLLTVCTTPRPDELSQLWPKGSSRFFRRPEGPVIRRGAVRIGLCFGDIVLRRVCAGDGVTTDPDLAIRGWYYLLLASEDMAELGRFLRSIVYSGSGESDEIAAQQRQGPDLNRGALTDLTVARASESHYAFVLETAYGACYEIWRELCGQGEH